MVREVTVPAGFGLQPPGHFGTGQEPVERNLPVPSDRPASRATGPEGHQSEVCGPVLDGRREAGLALVARR
eukprot:7260201-Alexandrium_andersonii.AAC.1